MTESRGASRRYLAGLVALLLAVVALLLVWVEPGPMTIDEVTYHRMTHGLVHGDGFFIANGYEEHHSQALTSMFVHDTGRGRLAAQYPYGGPAVAAPFYAAFGLRGPFFVSALAFVLAIWLCNRIAYQLLRDRTVAAAASALLATTYLTEYALGSWPHAGAVTCALTAFSLAVAGYQATSLRRSLLACLASGAVAGLGITMRLDALLCLPALGAPFFLASPTRVRNLVAIGVGLVPAAAFIVWTNYVRWGALSPVSYGPDGHDAGMHVGFLVVVLAVVAGVWIVTRRGIYARLRERPRYALAGALAALLAIVLVRGSVHDDAIRLVWAVHGIFAYVVDLRLRPGAGLIDDQTSAVMYAAGVKKALLQSCPFLVFAVLPIVRAIRRGEHRAIVAWLLVAPACVIGFFGMFAWHGGMCLNMRYALPALPFLCILAALAVRELAAAAPRAWPIPAGALALAAIAAYLALHRGADGEPNQTLVLTVPIVLAVAELAALVAWRLHPHARTALLALVVAGAGVGWSIAATIEDARWSRARRSFNYEVSECVAARISDGALVVTEVPDVAYAVVAHRDGVTIAVPGADQFANVHTLIGWHHARGRRVYAVVGPTMWKLLRAMHALDGYGVDTIERVGMFVLGEIRPARPDEANRVVDIDMRVTASCGPDHVLWPTRFDPRFGPPIAPQAAR